MAKGKLPKAFRMKAKAETESPAEEKMDASITDLAAAVRVQNGRIGKIELWRAGLDAIARTHSWRWPAVIGIAASIIASGVGAVVTYAITNA